MPAGDLMNLEEFVSDTLTQIVRGVRTAQGEAKLAGAVVCPSRTRTRLSGNREVTHHARVQEIEFDVAVTVVEGTTVGGDAGIRVFAVGGGAKGERHGSHEQLSRVRFSVPVMLPMDTARPPR